MSRFVTEAQLALATRAGLSMGNSPIWPATRGNLLGYLRTQRHNLTWCSRNHVSDINFSIYLARRALLALRRARIGGAA